MEFAKGNIRLCLPCQTFRVCELISRRTNLSLVVLIMMCSSIDTSVRSRTVIKNAKNNFCVEKKRVIDVFQNGKGNML